jgi:hypothetical protein
MATAHPFSLESARRAAERDGLGDWVAEFLASPGSDNEVLAAELTEPPRHWLGPVALPLERLHRFAGPAGHPVLRVTREDEWRDDVGQMAELVDDGSELPPVVVTYRQGALLVEDGNHRVEALRRAGASEAWAVVGFDTAEDLDRFRNERRPS